MHFVSMAMQRKSTGSQSDAEADVSGESKDSKKYLLLIKIYDEVLLGLKLPRQLCRGHHAEAALLGLGVLVGFHV